MSILAPFQLLELNIISAQDLANVSRNMQTYAVSWVHPDRKLTTRVDTNGRTNPTWNDKFVFRVDEEFLHADTSAVMIEIYALHWFRDIHVGTVRVLVGNVIPPPTRGQHNQYPQLGMRFVALQVRRPSGRPQGILNIGVTLLDSSMRSMPLYTHLDASAVGYRHLMGEEDPHLHHHSHGHDHHQHDNHGILQQQHHTSTYGKPELRRTKSDTSSMIGSAIAVPKQKPKKKASSMISGSEVEPTQRKKGSSKASSMISASEFAKKGKKGKSGSMINGSEVSDPPKKGNKDGLFGSIIINSEVVNKDGLFGSIITNSEVVDPPKKIKIGKSGSMVSGSETDDPPIKVRNEFMGSPMKSKGINGSPMKSKGLNDKPYMKYNGLEYGSPYKNGLAFGSPYKPVMGLYGLEYGTPMRSKFASRPIITESELGPSPSEVAAAIAKDPFHPVEETESSIAGGWSVESSVEGLRSKLERWRSELPPVYDIGEYSSFPSSRGANGNSNGNVNVNGNGNGSKHKRRHTDGDSGLFSCFGKICGCECSIVCGSGSGSNSGSVRKNGNSERFVRSPVHDDMSYL